MTLEQQVGPARSDLGLPGPVTLPKLTGLPWRRRVQAGLARRRPARLGDLARGRAGTHCQSHSVTGRDCSVADRLVRLSPTAAPWPRRRARRRASSPRDGRLEPGAQRRGAEPAESARWGSKLNGLSRPARTRGPVERTQLKIAAAGFTPPTSRRRVPP